MLLNVSVVLGYLGPGFLELGQNFLDQIQSLRRRHIFPNINLGKMKVLKFILMCMSLCLWVSVEKLLEEDTYGFIQSFREC